MDDYIVGIDIGSSKVCSAVGKIDKQGRLQVLGVITVKCNGLKKGVVVDIDNTAESIKKSIEQLSTMIDIDITNAYISLPVGICELITSKGVIAISSENREISRNDIERVLNAAKIISIPSNKEIVGTIPNQYIIDGYGNIKDPIGMSGVKLEVDAHIILAQSTMVENLIKSVNKAGIKVSGIVLETLAISQAVAKNDEVNMATALIDIGAEKIDISVHKRDNIIYTDTIPYGGNTITSDISICLKISFSEAEKLKIKYGTLVKSNNHDKDILKLSTALSSDVSINTSLLTEIIEARVQEFFEFIKRRLEDGGYYEDISSVVIVGGGVSFFDGVCDLGKMVFCKSARIGVPEYVGASNPACNTAVGIIKDVVKTQNTFYLTNKTGVNSSGKNKVLKEQNETFENSGVLSKIKGFLADFF